MDKLFDQLREASKVKDITEVIKKFTKQRTLSWKAVGNNDNNLATINIGSDPAAGVIERITNAIDSILERTWKEKGEPTHLKSPRKSVEEWFDIPNGKLGSLERFALGKFDTLAKRVRVTLRDGDKKKNPSIDIRDFGIGIKSEDFSQSILSLNGSRKLQKLFLVGAYGQGGSTALAYSEYTVIISRYIDVYKKKLSPVAATIVRLNPGDPNREKHGLYEYMVNSLTGEPFAFEIDESDFPAGTLVRHITMDLAKYHSVMTAPSNSLWFLTHNYLFDPIIPFTIEDLRTNVKATSLRTVTGNNRLLTQSDKTEYWRKAERSFECGQITIYWWVLSSEGEKSKKKITQYTMVSKPIIVTYNGQKQGYFPNTVIKDDLKLPYLDRYLIVHVDCDNVDNETRRLLFPTTRESIRDTDLGDNLRKLITSTLESDDELKRLDKERRKKYIQSVDSSSVEKIRKRLSKRINIFTKAGGGGKGPRVTAPPGTNTSSEPKPLIPIKDPPVFISITNESPRQVYAGKSFTLKFETDARPDYFNSPNTFLAAIDPPSFGQYTGSTNVKNGYGTAYFKASEDAEIDEVANITLEIRPPRNSAISGSIKTQIIDFPEEAGSEPGGKTTPNINPQFIDSTTTYWKEQEWTKQTVASVETSEDSVEVYVSEENEKLSRLLERAQRDGEDAIKSIKEFYLEHISYHALISDLDRKKRNSREQREEENNEEENADLHVELKHACDTISGIIDSIYSVLITGIPSNYSSIEDSPRSEKTGENISE